MGDKVLPLLMYKTCRERETGKVSVVWTRGGGRDRDSGEFT